MSEIFSKYKANIDNVLKSLSIHPKDYKFKKSIEVDDWFVYFRCLRVGTTKNKQYRFRTIKVNGQKIAINRLKDHEARVDAIELLRNTIKRDFKTHPKVILEYMYGNQKARELHPEAFDIPLTKDNREFISIKAAFEEVFAYTDTSVAEGSAKEYKSKWSSFLNFIGDLKENDVKTMDKKMVRNFLETTTKDLSNTSFNNLRQLMNMMVKALVKRDYLDFNFVEGIERKSKSATRNKPFTKSQMDKLSKLLENDPYMRFYCNHILCGLMRPTTISRLKAKHIDIENRMFKLKTKTNLNKKEFLKFIVDPLWSVYEKLDLSNPEACIFGDKGLVEIWSKSESQRQKAMGVRFKYYKDLIGSDKDNTLKSLRHNGIGYMCKAKLSELKEANTPNSVNEACKYIMQFTNHTTVDQVKQYLRNLVPDIHEDWSKYTKKL